MDTQTSPAKIDQLPEQPGSAQPMFLMYLDNVSSFGSTSITAKYPYLLNARPRAIIARY